MLNKAIPWILMLILTSIGAILTFEIQLARTEPGTIIVPDDYQKIQWAVGNASAGDTIFVKAGIYYELVQIDKSLHLIGEDRETTIVDGLSQGETISIKNASYVEVANLTIQNGRREVWSVGSGIYISQSSRCNITCNIIRDNDCGITLTADSTLNIIYGNLIKGSHGIFPYGIMVSGWKGLAGENKIIQNTFQDNSHAIGVYGSGNEICLNSFSSGGHIHIESAYSWTINVWDNVSMKKGNYWNGFTCVDPDGDGVSNIPYVVNYNNQDDFPLCSPVPLPWGKDYFAPEIVSFDWIRTCPNRFLHNYSATRFKNDTVRETEPVIVRAKAVDSESGVENVYLSYRVNESEWFSVKMSYNSTSSMYEAEIPGQKANSTIEFCFTACDKAGNKKTVTDMAYAFRIQYLKLGDMEGDGDIDIVDIAIVAKNFGYRFEEP